MESQGGIVASGIIIYRTSYGSTKPYAEWLGEETGFPVYDQKSARAPWSEADIVVLGCPIIANKPFLSGWIRKQWDRMKEKHVHLFTTSGADPASAPVSDWIAAGFPQEIFFQIRSYPLPGRFEFAKLSGLHKLMLPIGAVVFETRTSSIRSSIPWTASRRRSWPR